MTLIIPLLGILIINVNKLKITYQSVYVYRQSSLFIGKFYVFLYAFIGLAITFVFFRYPCISMLSFLSEYYTLVLPKLVGVSVFFNRSILNGLLNRYETFDITITFSYSAFLWCALVTYIEYSCNIRISDMVSRFTSNKPQLSTKYV